MSLSLRRELIVTKKDKTSDSKKKEAKVISLSDAEEEVDAVSSSVSSSPPINGHGPEAPSKKKRKRSSNGQPSTAAQLHLSKQSNEFLLEQLKRIEQENESLKTKEKQYTETYARMMCAEQLVQTQKVLIANLEKANSELQKKINDTYERMVAEIQQLKKEVKTSNQEHVHTLQQSNIDMKNWILSSVEPVRAKMKVLMPCQDNISRNLAQLTENNIDKARKTKHDISITLQEAKQERTTLMKNKELIESALYEIDQKSKILSQQENVLATALASQDKNKKTCNVTEIKK